MTTTTITGHMLDLPGQRVHYLAAGDPALPPLILLHGVGTNANIWRVNLPTLGQHFYAIALDLSGYGRSDKPLRLYTLDYQARLVRELIAALELARVTLIGNSMGGAISLWLAHRHPELVQAMVLADPFGVGLWWRLDWRAILTRLVWPTLRTMLLGINRRDYHKVLSFSFYNVDNLPPEIASTKAIHTWGFNPRSRALAGAGLGLRLGSPLHRWRFLQQLRQLPHPTLIVWGQNDRVLPVAWAHQLHAALPNSQLHIYPHCGHVPPLELPGDFNRRAIAFLQPLTR